MKFKINDIVKIKKSMIFSKGFKFKGRQVSGSVNQYASYKITEFRKIEYSSGLIVFEYLLGRKSVWVKESEIYKISEISKCSLCEKNYKMKTDDIGNICYSCQDYLVEMIFYGK